MKKVGVFLLLLLSIIACNTKEKTDQELLALDKKRLSKNLYSSKVLPYKFAKILIRSSIEKDTVSKEFKSFRKDIDKLSKIFLSYKLKEPKKLSLLDYVRIYRDYKKMESFIRKTDEDIFPTTLDALNMVYGDSISKQRPYYKGEKKQFVQNTEHAMLSAITVLSKDLGREISLYECAMTKPDLLPDSELKTLLSFYRGFLFFEKKLYYLSEEEFTRNITWLNTHKEIDLFFTRAIFQWGNLTNAQTHTAMHSLNHVFRGFDRLMMKRKIDEDRALEDFEAFLKDAEKIGMQNEMIWAIETYVYLKKERKEKAIASLKKLQLSALLSSAEKEKIENAIGYLKHREKGNMLNGVYDKYFLGKIATKYMFSILAKVHWKKLLKEQNVPYTKEIFGVINQCKDFTEKLSVYSTKDGIKEAGKDLKEQSKGLLDKAQELLK